MEQLELTAYFVHQQIKKTGNNTSALRNISSCASVCKLCCAGLTAHCQYLGLGTGTKTVALLSCSSMKGNY